MHKDTKVLEHQFPTTGCLIEAVSLHGAEFFCLHLEISSLTKEREVDLVVLGTVVNEAICFPAISTRPSCFLKVVID
jgi:hypothetical protein